MDVGVCALIKPILWRVADLRVQIIFGNYQLGSGQRKSELAKERRVEMIRTKKSRDSKSKIELAKKDNMNSYTSI